ncbi:hypothetical protein ACLVWU_05225 [Bdellovibrio sp. HCB290]|uniref:hypothetical protein n=1 Tax=Bdellovibrio sp. HCB290 TaxID=3394356 RepID=UPI0039B4982D
MKLTMDKSIIVFSFIASLLLGTPALSANSAECVNKDSLSKTLSQFKISHLDEDGEVLKDFELEDACVGGAFQAVAEGVQFLRKIPAPKNLPSRYATLISQEGPTKFLNNRIKEIHITWPNDYTCEQGALGYVKSDETENRMYICNHVNIHDYTPLYVAHILVHEARHIDGFPHQQCIQGMFNFDIYACDSSYQEQGSYGIGTGLMLYTYKGAKNEALRDEARSNIVLDMTNRFNTLPMELSSGAILQDTQNNISFYDGNETTLGEFTDEISVMTSRLGTPYIFFKNGEVSKYLFTKEWPLLEGSLVDNYRKLKRREMNELIDINFDLGYCFLFPKQMKCLQEGRFHEFSFSALNPVSFWPQLLGKDTSNAILNDDGKVYTIRDEIKEFVYSENEILNSSELQIKNRYPGVTSWTMLGNGRILGVSPEGYMMQSVSKGKWKRAKEFEDYKFKRILPFMWSKKLEAL